MESKLANTAICDSQLLVVYNTKKGVTNHTTQQKTWERGLDYSIYSIAYARGWFARG